MCLNYIQKIRDLSSTSFNKDQKLLAEKILINTADEDLENVYKLISKRVKTGFVFDSSPAINNQSVAILKENKELSLLDLNKNQEQYDKNGITNDNLLIIGENYDALKNLLLTHKGKVDVIYIDPPYNTDASINEKNNLSEDEILQKSSNKFVYRDKFSRTGWLNMMQDRLYMARDLLADDGVIFVSIDDNEQAYLKVLMDEIFGEENFISDLIWIRNPGGESDNNYIAKTKDFILFYSRNKKLLKINNLKKEIDILDYERDNKGKLYKKGSMLEKSGEGDRLIDRPNLGYIIYYNPLTNEVEVSDNAYNKSLINEDLTTKTNIYKINQDLINNGWVPIIPREIKGTYGRWRKSSETFLKEFHEDKYIFEKSRNNVWKIYEKSIIGDDLLEEIKPKDFISFTSNSNGTSELKKIFDDSTPFTKIKPKPSNLISYLINMHTNNNSIVLDFFAGSGTTAQAVMELNEEDGGTRKFILCTNNAEHKGTGKFIATDICYERIHRIVKGSGTKGEVDFKWIQERHPYKCNNFRVFDIEYCDVSINANLENIINKAKQSMRLIDNNFSIDEKDIVYKLSSLSPLVKGDEND